MESENSQMNRVLLCRNEVARRLRAQFIYKKQGFKSCNEVYGISALHMAYRSYIVYFLLGLVLILCYICYIITEPFTTEKPSTYHNSPSIATAQLSVLSFSAFNYLVWNNMTTVKKKITPMSALGKLATAARCGPGTARKPFTSWAESSKIKLAKYVREEVIQFGTFDSECADLVIGLILLDKSEKEILEILKTRFAGIQEAVFKYVFADEFKSGKDIADALVTNAAYQKAITGNVQAIKIIGIKMGWLSDDGSDDMEDINEILRVFVKKKVKE